MSDVPTSPWTTEQTTQKEVLHEKNCHRHSDEHLVQVFNKCKDVRVPAETLLTFRLNQPASLQAER